MCPPPSLTPPVLSPPFTLSHSAFFLVPLFSRIPGFFYPLPRSFARRAGSFVGLSTTPPLGERCSPLIMTGFHGVLTMVGRFPRFPQRPWKQKDNASELYAWKMAAEQRKIAGPRHRSRPSHPSRRQVQRLGIIETLIKGSVREQRPSGLAINATVPRFRWPWRFGNRSTFREKERVLAGDYTCVI